MGYSRQAESPPLHLKTIMSFILRLTKKENSNCVSVALRGVVMIATKWLLSHRGGRDKEVECSTGATPIHIIGVCFRVCNVEMREGDTLVVSWQLVKRSLFSCISIWPLWVHVLYVSVSIPFCLSSCLYSFHSFSISPSALSQTLCSFFTRLMYVIFLSQACSFQPSFFNLLCHTVSSILHILLLSHNITCLSCPLFFSFHSSHTTLYLSICISPKLSLSLFSTSPH